MRIGIKNLVGMLLVAGVLGIMQSKVKKGKATHTEDGLQLKEQNIITILGAILVGFGVIALIECIRDKEDLWVFVLFGIMLFSGLWMMGRGVFWEVIVNKEQMIVHSSFFGKQKVIPMNTSIRVVYDEDGKNIRVYNKKKRIMILSTETIVGVYQFWDMIKETPVSIEDRRPTIKKFHVFNMKLEIVIFIVAALFTAFLAVSEIIYNGTEDICMIILCITIVIVCGWYGLYIKAMSLKVDDNEICYKNLFEKERRFQFCDITGCELKKEMLIYRIVCYKEKEVIAKVLVTAKNADLFWVRLKKEKIPVVREVQSGNSDLEKFKERVKELENQLMISSSYLNR